MMLRVPTRALTFVSLGSSFKSQRFIVLHAEFIFSLCVSCVAAFRAIYAYVSDALISVGSTLSSKMQTPPPGLSQELFPIRKTPVRRNSNKCWRCRESRSVADGGQNFGRIGAESIVRTRIVV